MSVSIEIQNENIYSSKYILYINVACLNVWMLKASERQWTENLFYINSSVSEYRNEDHRQH